MIPHSKLSDESFNVELKNRVTACRRRLRQRRSTYKSKEFRNPNAEIFADTGSASFTEDFSAGNAGRTVEEQEVGIT
jgi:hypothetical protein